MSSASCRVSCCSSSRDSCYKAITGSNPFPDNATTNAVTDASDFSSLQQIMLGNTSVYKTLTIMVEFAAVAILGSSVIANVIKIPWMIEGKPDEISGIIKQVSIPTKLFILSPQSFSHGRVMTLGRFRWMLWSLILYFSRSVSIRPQLESRRWMYGTVSPYIDYAIRALLI